MHDYLLVGRAGLEPAHLPHIRRAPLPVWLPPLGTERGSRPPGLPRMKRALCQLSYLGVVLTPGVEPDPAAYQTVMQTAYTRSGRKPEALIPSGSSPPTRFRTGAGPGRFSFHTRKTEALIPRRSPASPAFQAGPARAGSSSMSGRRADRTRVGRQPQPRFSKPVPLPLGQPSIVR